MLESISNIQTGDRDGNRARTGKKQTDNVCMAQEREIEKARERERVRAGERWNEDKWH